jgi:hypothetical protein
MEPIGQRRLGKFDCALVMASAGWLRHRSLC